MWGDLINQFVAVFKKVGRLASGQLVLLPFDGPLEGFV